MARVAAHIDLFGNVIVVKQKVVNACFMYTIKL